jgi:phage gpG-like protein
MNLDAFAAQMKNAATELRRREVLSRVAKAVELDAKRSIDTSRDVDGLPFKPLADGSGRRPLFKTGELYNAIRAFVRGTAVVVTCAVPQANIQNFGGTIRKPERRRLKPWVFVKNGVTIFTRRIRAHTVTIPRRQFVGGESGADAVVKVLLEMADKAFGRA